MGCLLVSDIRPTVGDEVVVVASRSPYDNTFPTGSTFVIDIDDLSDTPYGARRDGVTWWFLEDEVELVNKPEPVPEVESEDIFARFYDEVLDDAVVFNALLAMGIDITKEEYATALEIGVKIEKAKEARKG